MFPVTQVQLLYGLGAALMTLLFAVVWLISRMHKLQRSLPETLGDSVHESLEAQHREMLNDLHHGLIGQADRLMAAGQGQSEQIRTRVEAELKTTRDAMRILHAGMQTQLGEARSDTRLQLTALNNAMVNGQNALRSEMIEQTLNKLGEHARADRELLQSGLRSSSDQLAQSISGSTRVSGKPTKPSPM